MLKPIISAGSHVCEPPQCYVDFIDTQFKARDGIAAEVSYPSVGMEVCNIPDLELKQVCMEVYNRWLPELFLPYPDRLYSLDASGLRTAA